MIKPNQPFICKTIIWPVAAMLALLSPIAVAKTVYKCVKDGKISYTSDLAAKHGQCEQTVIRDKGPDPAYQARLLEEKRLRQEEQRKADQAALQEREVRAREIEADAASRRARALENELLLRQTQPSVPNFGYQPLYPYGWGGGILLPMPRPGVVNPIPPIYPNIPHRPTPAPPTGAVRVR